MFIGILFWAERTSKLLTLAFKCGFQYFWWSNILATCDISGCECSLFISIFWTNGLEDARMTMCASICWSSPHTRVKSAKSMSSLRDLPTEILQNPRAAWRDSLLFDWAWFLYLITFCVYINVLFKKKGNSNIAGQFLESVQALHFIGSPLTMSIL